MSEEKQGRDDVYLGITIRNGDSWMHRDTRRLVRVERVLVAADDRVGYAGTFWVQTHGGYLLVKLEEFAETHVRLADAHGVTC